MLRAVLLIAFLVITGAADAQSTVDDRLNKCLRQMPPRQPLLCLIDVSPQNIRDEIINDATALRKQLKDEANPLTVSEDEVVLVPAALAALSRQYASLHDRAITDNDRTRFEKNVRVMREFRFVTESITISETQTERLLEDLRLGTQSAQDVSALLERISGETTERSVATYQRFIRSLRQIMLDVLAVKCRTMTAAECRWQAQAITVTPIMISPVNNVTMWAAIYDVLIYNFKEVLERMQTL